MQSWFVIHHRDSRFPKEKRGKKKGPLELYVSGTVNLQKIWTIIIPQFAYIHRTNPYLDECLQSTKLQKIFQKIAQLV